MKSFYSLFIILIIFFFSSIHSIYAQDLKLPSLEKVMKENEKREKILRKKAQFKTSPLGNRASRGGSYTYKTLIAGKSVRLSGYNEINLWVQEVNLAEGAKIGSILSQSGYDPNSGEPLFAKKRITDVLSELEKKPFSLINGQFFDPKREYTPLSFGIKEGSTIRSAGADNRNESKNILIIRETSARILPYSWENLRDADGYFALVSLAPSESRNRDEAIGRTYICLQDIDRYGESKKLIIFTALALSEAELENELPRWGCTREGIAKLDSSGSTRLWIDNEYIYGKSHQGDPDYRKIPHYIAVWDNI